MSDWTLDPETRRSNASREYLICVEDVERTIRDGAHSLIAGNADSVARAIVSRLAHIYELAPPSQEAAPEERP